MKKNPAKFVALAGIIAALYIVLTYLCSLVGLSSYVIQVRLSEALCVLPYFTPAAIPGLFVGCIIANFISGSLALDVVFGSLATLAGAITAYFISKPIKKSGNKPLKILVSLPNVIANTIVVPFVLRYVYEFGDAMWFMFLTVGAGEIISTTIFGTILLFAFDKRQEIFR